MWEDGSRTVGVEGTKNPEDELEDLLWNIQGQQEDILQKLQSGIRLAQATNKFELAARLLIYKDQFDSMAQTFPSITD